MKRLLLVLSFCFVIVGVKAQNIWKPISYSGTFLGAGPDGSIYCYENDITCSKDEGATWQITLPAYDYRYNYYCFTVSPEGRIFLMEDKEHRMWHSDNNGLTWQYSSPIPLGEFYTATHIYAASNNIIVGSTTYNNLFWTTDGGVTWQTTELGESDCAIQDLVVKENGDVYFCLYNYNRMLDQGVYHSTINDMHNWEVVAFDGILRSPQVTHQTGKNEWQ